MPAIAAQNGKLKFERGRVLARAGDVETRNLDLPCGPGTPPVATQFVSNDDGSERVRFSLGTTVPASGWTIEVASADSGTSWSMSAAEIVERYTAVLQSGGPLDVWSGPVRGGAKSAALRRDSAASPCPSVRVSGLLKEALRSFDSSITPPNDLKSFASSLSEGPAAMTNWGSVVARIRFVGDDGKGYFCTGFLVTANLILTNQHCLSSQSETLSAELDFDYDADGAKPQIVRLKSLVRPNAARDYALAELAAPMSRQPLLLAASDYTKQPELVIVQHPAGKIKHVSIKQCKVEKNDVPGVTDAPTDFEHKCDTETGSSGSPVHHVATGHVVGLHHFGFEEGVTDGRNQAVKLLDVLNDLNANFSAMATSHPHLASELRALIDASLARR
jgi:V8-like Glu-specific endopeptidase